MILTTNRKSSFNYYFIEKFTAGIKLTGSEVKSIKRNDVSIDESYCYINNNEVFIKNMYVKPNNKEDFSVIDRKLLLNRREIKKIKNELDVNGLTLIPLNIFCTKNGLLKILIGFKIISLLLVVA